MKAPEENHFDNKYLNVTIRKKTKEKHGKICEAVELVHTTSEDNRKADDSLQSKIYVSSHSYRPSLVNVFPKRHRIGFYDYLDATSWKSSHSNGIEMEENDVPTRFIANLLPRQTLNISVDLGNWWIDDRVTEESFLAMERLCQSDEEEPEILHNATVFGSTLSNVNTCSNTANEIIDDFQNVTAKVTASNKSRASNYPPSLINVFPVKSRIGFYDYLDREK